MTCQDEFDLTKTYCGAHDVSSEELQQILALDCDPRTASHKDLNTCSNADIIWNDCMASDGNM